MSEQVVQNQLERSMDEVKSLRESLASVLDRLASAEGALMFYGDVKNYMTRPLCGVFTYQDVLKNDSELAFNTDNTKVAGFRAREFFKRYENLPRPRL